MKHRKYRIDAETLILKEKIRALSAKQRIRYRARKVFADLIVVSLFAEITALAFLAKNASSLTENAVLARILSVLFWALLIPLPVALTILFVFLLNRALPPFPLHAATRKAMEKIHEKRVRFYGLREPQLVTKCYGSSRKGLENRDVSLCYADGKIKLTNDFRHSFYDFGCYVFSPEEISFGYLTEGRIVKTELRTENDFFLLGRRAKSFLDKVLFSYSLDRKIETYNAINGEKCIEEKLDAFRKLYAEILRAEKEGMIRSDGRKKPLIYLGSILENDGPEYCYVIPFSSAGRLAEYEIGVCVRGLPILKKIR